MAGKVDLFILTISILFSTNTLCIAEADQKNIENEILNLNIFEVLVRECFPSNSDTLDIPYKGNNIVEALNSEAGAELFVPSKIGVTIDTKVFSNLLGNCINNNIDRFSNNKNVQSNIRRAVSERQTELNTVVNYYFRNQEIPLNDIETLIKSRSTRRSKRDTTNIIQEILINLVITPLKSGLNSVLNSVNTALESYVVSTENITNPIQSFVVQALNAVLETAISLTSNIQTNLNAFLESFEGTNSTSDTTNSTSDTARVSNSLARSKTRDLAFPFNILSDLIENTIVGPIRTTINGILVTLNTTIYSLYTANSTATGVQAVLDSTVNGVVLNCVDFINVIYAQINTILNNISGANVSTTA